MIKRVSVALGAVLGCAKTYVAEFAEHPQHPHVHVHVIARPADLDPADVGPGIFRRAGLAEEAGIPEARMNEIAAAVRSHLAG